MAYSVFHNETKRCYDVCFPPKEFTSPGRCQRLGVPPQLLRTTGRRNELYKQFIKSRDLERLATYKYYTNLAIREL